MLYALLALVVVGFVLVGGVLSLFVRRRDRARRATDGVATDEAMGLPTGDRPVRRRAGEEGQRHDRPGVGGTAGASQ